MSEIVTERRTTAAATLIQPFNIDVSEGELQDLRDRLAKTRWPGDLPNVGWEYGVPVDYLKELAE